MNHLNNNDSIIKNKQKYNNNLTVNLNIDDKSSSTNKIANTTNESVNNNGNKLKRSKVLVNYEYCSYCDEGGNLINCDRCPVSFHLLCHEPPLEHDQIPKGEFLCNKCKSRAKLLPYHNMNINDPSEKLNEVPITNETKYVDFLKNEKDSTLETLIKLSKVLNPRQMTLSASLCQQLDVDIPGLNKNKWWNKDYRLFNGNALINRNSAQNNSTNLDKEPIERVTRNNSNFDNLNNHLYYNGMNTDQIKSSSNNNNYKNDVSQTLSKSRICFICRKLIKFDRLAKCDFCPLAYHLDCLNPPICAIPSREKLWMCPNHIEHYLEEYVLKSSCRFSERIKLWNNYSISTTDFDNIINNFIDKCQSNNLSYSSSTSNYFKMSVKRCKIPSPVRSLYVQKINKEEFESYKNIEENVCKNSQLEAVEALLLLSESKIIHSENKTNIKANNIQLETPSLNKKDAKSIKPRALLQLVSDVNIDDCQDFNDIKSKLSLLPLFNITNRSITIGYGSKVDICLKSMINKHNGLNLKMFEKCNLISEKHACIYYDESSNTYELLNYSQHGSYVNDNLYGFDFLDNNVLYNNNNEPNFLERGYVPNCSCMKKYDNDIYRQFEGSASLSHGSILRFGCFEFLFIIIDYDFVKCNLEKNINRNKLNGKINGINKNSQISSLFGNQIVSRFIETNNDNNNNKFVKRLNNFSNNSTNKKSLFFLKRNNSKRRLNNNQNGNNRSAKLSKTKLNNKNEFENQILNNFLSNENKKLLLI